MSVRIGFMAERIFNKHILNKDDGKLSKNLCGNLTKILLKHFNYDKFFPHLIETDASYLHQNHLIEVLVQRYFLFRCISYISSFNESGKKNPASTRNKWLKVTQFDESAIS
jgi:hypothetical protein